MSPFFIGGGRCCCQTDPGVPEECCGDGDMLVTITGFEAIPNGDIYAACDATTKQDIADFINNSVTGAGIILPLVNGTPPPCSWGGFGFFEMSDTFNNVSVRISVAISLSIGSTYRISLQLLMKNPPSGGFPTFQTSVSWYADFSFDDLCVERDMGLTGTTVDFSAKCVDIDTTGFNFHVEVA